MALPFWLAVAGIATAWYLYHEAPDLPKQIAMALRPALRAGRAQVRLRRAQRWLFAGGARALGKGFWKGGDQTVIDGLMVNGSARLIGWFSGVVRLLQTGLRHTTTPSSMLIGVVILA